MKLDKKVAIKNWPSLAWHNFLSFWSWKLGLKYDLALILKIIFRKWRAPKRTPTKNNTWSKKQQQNPKICKFRLSGVPCGCIYWFGPFGEVKP